MAKKRKGNSFTAAPVVGQEADDTLLDDLIAQLDSENPIVQQEAAAVIQEVEISNLAPPTPPSAEASSSNSAAKLKKNSKARFKEREARKATAKQANYSASDPNAEARLEQEAKDEETSIARLCNELGLQMFEVRPDGHCLFSAIGDQLYVLQIIPSTRDVHILTRRVAADYILSHPDDFLPFLPCPEGEDGRGATSSGLMSPQGLEKYCLNVRDTSIWGGEPEILALSRAFNIPIHVIQWGTPSVVIHSPTPGQPAQGPVAFISYHKRMYGLGEHYNSLRPRTRIPIAP